MREVDLLQVRGGRNVALAKPKLPMRVGIQCDRVREGAPIRRDGEEVVCPGGDLDEARREDGRRKLYVVATNSGGERARGKGRKGGGNGAEANHARTVRLA